MTTAVEHPDLDEARREIVALAREFARTRIEPHAAEWDRTHHFDRPVIDELGKLGFLGIATPDTEDGLGLDTTTYLLALEEIAAADASIAVSVSIHCAIPTTMLLRHGTRAQKDRWLKPMARGELLAGFALSEPDAGSDPASMRAQAVRDGDGWVLNGTKAWATNGGTADVMMIMVRTDRPEARRGAKGISTFIVPTNAPGYRPARPEDKMGLRASNTVGLVLENLRLPADALLGEEGMGFVYAMEGLVAGRLGIATQAVGIARRALEHAVAYCAERRQFDQPLEAFEAVQFKLADMATRVAAARGLTHAAAALKDAGRDVTVQASMAKLFASETAMWVTTQAVQLFGGYGYMRDFPVEKLFRDAKVTEIYEGTSEIQRLIIARGLTRHD
ncbi:MAG TPA: acyl-CoA dehydrogenase family protein [Gemmatimonadales bacterium]|nr:acyl-CoA dehydrogenase family protein [Gemmatimonadales bacterium]